MGSAGVATGAALALVGRDVAITRLVADLETAFAAESPRDLVWAPVAGEEPVDAGPLPGVKWPWRWVQDRNPNDLVSLAELVVVAVQRTGSVLRAGEPLVRFAPCSRPTRPYPRLFRLG